MSYGYEERESERQMEEERHQAERINVTPINYEPIRLGSMNGIISEVKPPTFKSSVSGEMDLGKVDNKLWGFLNK